MNPVLTLQGGKPGQPKVDTIANADGTGYNALAVHLTNESGAGSDVNIVSPIGQTVSADAVSVVIASDQSAIPITGSISTTPSVSNTTAGPTQVTVKTSDQKILNSARTTSVGFFVKNLGSTYIYVLCQTSGTASSSSLTESLAPGSGAWFPPFLWRGEVHLASSANGGLASYQDFTTP